MRDTVGKKPSSRGELLMIDDVAQGHSVDIDGDKGDDERNSSLRR